MVSIVIPLYNREKTIGMAIASILNQTYQDFEIIVVDDCSSDRSVEAVKQINDDRIRVILCEKNGGACVARNIGIENSNGDFIAFQDSDDHWHEDKLKKSLYFMEQKDADFVFSAVVRKGEKGYVKEERIVPSYNLNNEEKPLTKLLCMNCVSTQTIVAKKEVFKNIQFDKTLPRFQDWDLALQVLKSGYKMFYIEEPLVDCFVLEDSITSNYTKGKTALEILEKKYALDLENDRDAKYGFYYCSAVMMEKMDFSGAKYFLEAYRSRKSIGLLLRYFLSCLRLYRPLNKVISRYMGE